MKIGNVDTDQTVMIIAEIGNNHEGDVAFARDMVVAAAEAGADAVKFQTIEPRKLVAADQTARIAQLERFQLSRETFEDLAKTAAANNVMFLSSVFSLDAVDWLGDIMPAFKIASGDMTYTRLLEKVALTGKAILLSTGAADLDEVRTAQQTIEDVWARTGVRPGLAILHCTVNYPTAAGDANLSALADLATLGVTVGYSDHTLGNTAALLSVGMGARVIEKHFTLDNNHSDFRDHAVAADPAGFAELVNQVREAEMIIGSGGKRRLPCEVEAAPGVRRSVHAARDIAAGTKLTAEDTICLRPEGGITPAKEADLIGRTANVAIPAGTIIDENAIT